MLRDLPWFGSPQMTDGCPSPVFGACRSVCVASARSRDCLTRLAQRRPARARRDRGSGTFRPAITMSPRAPANPPARPWRGRRQSGRTVRKQSEQ